MTRIYMEGEYTEQEDTRIYWFDHNGEMSRIDREAAGLLVAVYYASGKVNHYTAGDVEVWELHP